MSVDADAERRPVRMRRPDPGRSLLEREGGPRRAHRVVGLVATLVEDGEDLVSDEFVHLGAVTIGSATAVAQTAAFPGGTRRPAADGVGIAADGTWRR